MAAKAPLTVVVLAAGQGTRLRSKTIKLLHPVAGRPMVSWVLDAVRGLGPSRLVTVVGHQSELVKETLGDTAGRYALQSEQRGGVTGLADNLQPGKISNLIRSNEVAFRVDFEDAVPP